jgi:hypothetical protein
LFFVPSLAEGPTRAQPSTHERRKSSHATRSLASLAILAQKRRVTLGEAFELLDPGVATGSRP